MSELDVEEFYATMGGRIRTYREACRLTQEQLAQAVGLGRASIANIEKGRQRLLPHTLFLIANTLRCSISALFPPQPIDAQDSVAAFIRSVQDEGSKSFVMDVFRRIKETEHGPSKQRTEES